MIDRLIHYLKDEEENRLTLLTTGLCSDYVQYRQVLAEFKTLRAIRDKIPELVIEEDDEE